MTKTTHWLAQLATAALICTGAWANDASNPKAYAQQLPLTLAAEGSLQRLVLPAQALLRLQTNNYSDLRVFNAQGQAVPMALASAVASNPVTAQVVQLVAFPITGPASTSDLQGLSLRIEEKQGKRVVELNSAASATPGSTRVLGALFDARTVSTPVGALTLDVDLPIDQPIAFALEASKDLVNWRALADTVLYRVGESAPGRANLGMQRMELGGADLKNNYLRVSWRDANGQAAPSVTVRAASLSTSQTSLAPRVTATLATPALTSPHELSFALPFATPLAAIQIKPQGTNVLIPVRVWGRNDRSQPWNLLASTVVYQLQNQGKEQASGAVQLSGAAFKEIRLEADTKTPGFVGLPQVTLQFEPPQLLFLASGAAPFTLAVGLANAVNAYLPVVSLLPGYQSGQENTLPLARAELDAAALAPTAVAATSNAPATRSLVLWGVLLLGVLLLAGMAWALLKQTQKPPLPPAG
jgi:hypothetical protein